jgi:hypothetical protein
MNTPANNKKSFVYAKNKLKHEKRIKFINQEKKKIEFEAQKILSSFSMCYISFNFFLVIRHSLPELKPLGVSVVLAIMYYNEYCGHAPTCAEIAAIAQPKSESNVSTCINTLVRSGRIVRGPGATYTLSPGVRSSVLSAVYDMRSKIPSIDY